LVVDRAERELRFRLVADSTARLSTNILCRA
jgi:hypothetical protein